MTFNFSEIISFFNYQSTFTISKIEWWLLKYSNYYKEASHILISQNLLKNNEESIARLPYVIEETDLEKFIDLYEALDTICEFHRNEEYFEQELIKFHKVKSSYFEKKNWIAKNEYLGIEKYVSFLIDYLDYSEKPEHLNIFIYSLKELEVYIDRSNFKNTIEFVEIFNNLYWKKDILGTNQKN